MIRDRVFFNVGLTNIKSNPKFILFGITLNWNEILIDFSVVAVAFGEEQTEVEPEVCLPLWKNDSQEFK
jgi:hypothetical protein